MESKRRTAWTRVVTASFIASASLVVAGRHVQAQELAKPNPEVQELREKLQRLEQTVLELKKQLSAMEQPRIAPAVATSTQPAAVATTAPVAPSVSSPSAAPPVVQPVETTRTSQDKQGESTFNVYGFAMLDFGYQFRQNHPDWFDVIRPTKLPSFGGEFAPNGKVYSGVRQSRLGVKSSTPTSWGELKTQFEFELFGTGVDAGQTTFRLRHAYGELGPVGAGQYWSPFMDIDVFPNSIEYWGPNGMVFFRNVQFRWMPLKGRNAVTIALERPGASGDQGVFQDRIELQGIRGKFDLPDLSGHLRLNRDWGHVQFAGMVRRIKWVDTNSDQFNLSGSDVGWGATVSSNYKFTPNDIGRFQFIYGEGVQNYMNDAPVDVGIQIENPADPVRPIRGVALPVLGVVSFLDHNWNKKFSTSIGYSMVNIENSSGQAANAYHRGHYALTNLLFTPVDNVMIGGEFQWGRRENWRDGFASDDYRIQFSFRYNFSKVFSF
ncbi:MAG TPA: DcaP family trimeric outer membrane transporter [Blastocatellia bacterium]|nr:DcaP family trimeric outer membrane transporter [Blastocatellia bacterium]